jgi:branched-chain amino acid aminotransferase
MSAPYIQANTNGRLHSAHEPSLSPLDRGFLYGDAIYEVWRTYHGVVFAWDEHLDRLGRSALALGMQLPWDRAQLWGEVLRTVKAFRLATQYPGEVYIRLQVSRGGGAIGLDIALADTPTFVLLVQPCPAPAPALLQRGLTLAIAGSLRRNPIESLSPAWKTGNYLNNVLGLREARADGADEVLLLNLAGELTEASTSNVALVRDGVVLTPPLAAGILEGITRAFILREVAPAAGVKVVEQPIRPADLAGMAECFLLSSTRDVMPVRAIDGVNFAVGPDTVTARLKAAFAKLTQASAEAHPERRV